MPKIFKAELTFLAWRAAICYRWCDAREAEAVRRRRADGGRAASIAVFESARQFE